MHAKYDVKSITGSTIFSANFYKKCKERICEYYSVMLESYSSLKFKEVEISPRSLQPQNLDLNHYVLSWWLDSLIQMCDHPQGTLLGIWPVQLTALLAQARAEVIPQRYCQKLSLICSLSMNTMHLGG